MGFPLLKMLFLTDLQNFLKKLFPTFQLKLASFFPKLLLHYPISFSQSIYYYLKLSCMYAHLPHLLAISVTKM